MPTSHSREIPSVVVNTTMHPFPNKDEFLRDWHGSIHDPQRIARYAILNGMPIPAKAAAQLEARGINVGDLENHIRQNMEFVR